MANAKKCDRCGKLYEENCYGRPYETQRLDLCPTCMDKFKQFMADGKTEENIQEMMKEQQKKVYRKQFKKK